MKGNSLLSAGAGIFAAISLAASAAALAQDTVRVRGTIEKVEGSTYVVKARDGSEMKVVLAEKAMVVAIVKASLDDIKPGSFVGVTGRPQPDGSQKAVEVHIFPEAMRGTGEGHRPWDLEPGSTMTNATVEHLVTGKEGNTFDMKYKDGTKKITVGPDVPVVTYEPADRAELKPGTKIFVAAATKMPDGSLQAPRVSFGRNGMTPPM
jgi:hypothetical protein